MVYHEGMASVDRGRRFSAFITIEYVPSVALDAVRSLFRRLEGRHSWNCIGPRPAKRKKVLVEARMEAGRRSPGAEKRTWNNDDGSRPRYVSVVVP